MSKRILRGVVVVDNSDKTVSVRVERRFSHNLFRKTIRKFKKYAAHDEENKFKIGDFVYIEESRPFSRRKTWKVIGYFKVLT
ncbi:30S ribosomal protein S17 [Candidatus Liberibacter americanus]|uniref:Small ribosomal subunit protein uS17 n=1 Tax=Candidatus Liberibacter americanus str. Sao Paulo TaxID=1261131 RepID=U6B8T8_9HYPH|nr:30S ribosomal protein S17 [Candidatus Liberibacter americanus]AHA28266.1 Ribosomal protein S17 [Candidatus Liberibacter americanus str. Sao Paulo]EMS36220.1 30S ribosomal protein S17 [Candidatus Liberibacter americanus PW_SP]